MLTEIDIENLGIISRLELVLGPGLTVLSGETGAGKTMLVEAIELLVGGRADSSMVRSGATEARVDGRFLIDDQHEVVISRVVPIDGRSRAYVDGRPSTVAALASITSPLIDLHGQHAHQSLLSASAQRGSLDQFAGVDLSDLRAARAAHTEVTAALATLGGDERTRAREIDLLRFQVAELDAAHLEDVDEEHHLSELEELLADAVAHRTAGFEALSLMADEGAARDALAASLTALGDRLPYGRIATRIASTLADLDDLITDLRSTVESIDEDPERLAVVRARRQTLRDLFRKYGDDLHEVMAFHVSAAERLHELESFELRAAELVHQLDAAIAQVESAADAVGTQRRTAAPALAAAVTEALRHLAMPHAAVAVAVGGPPEDRAGEHVEFLLAANPGSALLPLTRVASGGELARTMLALRLALLGRGEQRHDRTIATLVFDEVDAGIGGAAALAVAGALSQLSDQHQVLVVTHLAQVAACATRHVVVVKEVSGGTTDASARVVVDRDRVDEIARMLSGEPTDVAREHARDLLEQSARSARARPGRG